MNIFLEKYLTEHLLTVTCETIREKCPNTEFFLVRIFPHSDWIRRFTPYSVRMRENTTRKNSVFEHFSRCENFIREWIVPETTHSENFYPSFETDFLELLLALVTSTFSVIVCLKISCISNCPKIFKTTSDMNLKFSHEVHLDRRRSLTSFTGHKTQIYFTNQKLLKEDLRIKYQLLLKIIIFYHKTKWH